MVELTSYGGVNEIGGNKILLEDNGTRGKPNSWLPTAGFAPKTFNPVNKNESKLFRIHFLF